jgi:integrase
MVLSVKMEKLMPKTELSSHFITSVVCPEGKRKETFFDTRTRGLTFEVRASGGRTYYLRYTDDRGKTRYTKLADARDVTLAQARKLCDQARTKLAMGEDPIEQKAVKRRIPTLEEFVREQYLPFIKVDKRSWGTDECLLRNHILPALGRKHLDEITSDDVIRLMHKGIQDGAAPATVNRWIVILRYMYNLVIHRWKLPGVEVDPTAGIGLLKENNCVERYVTEEEMARLYEAVTASASPMLKYIVAFLILTGARRGEVLHATWADIDLARGDWRISKTKAGEARHIPLNEGAIKVLEAVRGLSRSEYIFGNPKTGKPYVHIWQAWNTARKKAGLEDVRMHDLRHTFASLLINTGRSLYEVQKLLGHTQIQTTQRYAHLARTTLIEASNLGTTAIMPCLGLATGDGPIIQGRAV